MIPTDITWQWITSQGFAAVALVAMVCAYQLKKKSWTLVAVMIFNSMMAISSIFLQSWLMVGLFALGFFRDGAFLIRERFAPNNFPISVAVLGFFLIGSVLVGIFTYRWWFDIPLVAASMFVDFGSWKKGIHWVRISRFTWCAMVIVNHVQFTNLIAVGIEAFVIASIIIFYVMFFIKKRREQNAPIPS